MVTSSARAPGGVAKWRTAPRVLPVGENDLVLSPLDPERLHPLVVIKDHGPEPTDDDADVKSPPPTVEATSHPARNQGLQKASSVSSINSTEVVALEAGELDPLGALAMGLSLDDSAGNRPKSATSDAKQRRATMERTTSFNGADQTYGTIKHMWTAHKDRVLAKLSDETFTIKASMLETNDTEGELSYASTSDYQPRDGDGLMTSSADGTAVVRKSRARLEQLERRQSSASMSSSSNRASTVKITQREYVSRLKQMQADLVKAWEQNMKVQALRIAIKCVKQLSDTSSAPQLYPLAFVLVSDILDEFGRLVFTRIKARASEDENGQPLPTPLGERFTSDEVNIHAKETCRNWFYKTACIRELLPRIYIEIALLRCYRFLGDGEFPQIVARLSNMIKGVGEPMVALYTRLYLALASTQLVSPSEKTAVLSSLFDYFFAFQQYQEQGKLTRFLDDQNLTHNDYLALHSPAVEWLMKCTAQDASNEVFEALVEQYKEYSDNSMVLKHLCESFSASSYALDPIRVFHLMRTAAPSQYSKCHLYSVLAVQLSNAPTIASGSKDAKLRFLNEAWSSITAQEDIEMYMECAAAYMKLIVAHYTHREATILLKDVMRHLNSTTPDELTPKVYNLLGAFIENVVYGAQQHAEFFTRLIPSGEFLSLMGMFRREASVGVAKKVLQAFVNARDHEASSRNSFASLRLHVVGPEAAVAHTLFVICCRVHDALDSLSTVSERHDATKDIAAFISRLGYARTPSARSSTVASSTMATTDAQLHEEEEALLMFYIDCRSAFYKLEPIKSVLTKSVIALAMRVRERMLAAARHKNGVRFTDRRRDFIKSCLAYAHITIPSIEQTFARLELLALCAKAALLNNCLPQLEAFLKSAIVLVADLDYLHATSVVGYDSVVGHEVAQDDETDPVVRVIKELVTIVTYAPSTVDDEPFYFVEALRKALLERMKWGDAEASGAPDRVRLQANACRIRVRILLAQLYASWGQAHLPTRVEGVDSNDVLYGVDEGFQQQTQCAFSAILEQAVQSIEALPTSSAMPSWEVASAQSELLVELVLAVSPFLSLDNQARGDDAPVLAEQEQPAESGATFLSKCVSLAHEKLHGVTEEAKRQHHEKLTLRADDLHTKFSNLVHLMSEYVHYTQKKRAPLYSTTARAALDALQTTLQTMTVVTP